MKLFNVHLISINLEPLMRLTDNVQNNSISCPNPEGMPCRRGRVSGHAKKMILVKSRALVAASSLHYLIERKEGVATSRVKGTSKAAPMYDVCKCSGSFHILLFCAILQQICSIY